MLCFVVLKVVLKIRTRLKPRTVIVYLKTSSVIKRIVKFLKYCVYTVIILVVLIIATIYIGHKLIFPIPYSETATIPDIKENGFCFGVDCQSSPTTVDLFIPVFANQIKHYNAIAYSLWPENSVVGLYVAVESIENDRSWLISPNGVVKILTATELKELCPARPRYNIGFSYFKNDSIQGTYLALSEDALKNLLEYQNYQYLGTYDLLLTYNHEMFHQLEQDNNWVTPETIHNRGRNPMLDNVEARTERHLLYKLLLEANSVQQSAEKDSIILQVLSNYRHYKNSYPDDFNAATYFDRIEGTAHYYEMISSLYSAYPAQIYSTETLKNALRILARSNNPKPYEEPGIDNESYIIGAWTGFLLDELQDDNFVWKKEIMQNADLTPLDILDRIYEGRTLPPPLKPTKELEEKVKISIQAMKDKKVAPGIFRMLYQLVF